MPQERALQASVAAHALHSKVDSREHLRPALEASPARLSYFEKLVDPDGVLDGAELGAPVQFRQGPRTTSAGSVLAHAASAAVVLCASPGRRRWSVSAGFSFAGPSRRPADGRRHSSRR